jgi:hypothetical protein
MVTHYLDWVYLHYGWAGLIGLVILAAVAGFVAFSWLQERGGRR